MDQSRLCHSPQGSCRTGDQVRHPCSWARLGGKRGKRGSTEGRGSGSAVREEGTTAVAILAMPRVYALDVSIAAHVFGRHPGYRVFVCGDHALDPADDPADDSSDGPGHVDVAADIRVTHSLSDLECADVVVVPGYENPNQPLPEEYLKALRISVERGARVVAVCTGVFALAACGMLNGRTATTHWRHTDELRSMYPEVDVVENRLFVKDGTILTSAGAGAGMDACLHVIQADFGTTVADDVARDVVFSPSVVRTSRSTGTRPALRAPACGRLGNGRSRTSDRRSRCSAWRTTACCRGEPSSGVSCARRECLPCTGSPASGSSPRADSLRGPTGPSSGSPERRVSARRRTFGASSVERWE